MSQSPQLRHSYCITSNFVEVAAGFLVREVHRDVRIGELGLTAEFLHRALHQLRFERLVVAPIRDGDDVEHVRDEVVIGIELRP